MLSCAGGCDKIRPLWRHYFVDMTAVIWVLDANDADRVKEAADELHMLLAVGAVGGDFVQLLQHKRTQERTDRQRMYMPYA